MAGPYLGTLAVDQTSCQYLFDGEEKKIVWSRHCVERRRRKGGGGSRGCKRGVVYSNNVDWIWIGAVPCFLVCTVELDDEDYSVQFELIQLQLW